MKQYIYFSGLLWILVCVLMVILRLSYLLTSAICALL